MLEKEFVNGIALFLFYLLVGVLAILLIFQCKFVESLSGIPCGNLMMRVLGALLVDVLYCFSVAVSTCLSDSSLAGQTHEYLPHISEPFWFIV